MRQRTDARNADMNGEGRMDNVTKEKRSYIMSRIKGSNTKPELTMEEHLKENRIDYEKHPRLFGKPDFLICKKHVLFVDGCFWHGCRKHYRKPESNKEFWKSKLKRNIARRKKVKKQLHKLGYCVMEIWEHEIKNGTYKRKIQKFVHGDLFVCGMRRLIFRLPMGRV